MELDTNRVSGQDWNKTVTIKNAEISARDIKIVELENRLTETYTEMLSKQNALDQSLQKVSALEQELGFQLRQVQLGRVIANDLDAMRSRRLFRLIERAFDRTDVSGSLPGALQQLKDDSLIFMPSLKGYLLQLSIGLQKLPFLSYKFNLGKPGLCGIQLAPNLDISASGGVFGVEIVSPDNQIVAQTVTPAASIQRDQPVSFSFEPVDTTVNGVFDLRVFTRDIDVPLRILEWRKYPPAGMGAIKTLPFCSFTFEDI